MDAEDKIREQIKQIIEARYREFDNTKIDIVNNPILKTKVGYIWPEDLIPANSKMNIADLGLKVYQEGLTKHVKWVRE